MFASRYFPHLMKKALISFKNFLYSEVSMMPLSLGYCLVITPINVLLNPSGYQGPQDQSLAHHLTQSIEEWSN